MKRPSGVGCLPYYWCALLCFLSLLPNYRALECHCSNCEENTCHTNSGACFVQFVETELDLVGKRGCVDEAAVFELCVDQSDEDIFCCYSDKCNHWSTGHNRQARISEKNKTDMENEDSSMTSDSTLKTIAIITGAVCMSFMIIAISVSLSLFYCYCCHDRRDRRTVDVECGDSSPSPVAGLGPVAFQPQGISLDKLNTSSSHPFPSLQQRHIVQHTSLEKNLEKGRFCETWIGVWRRDKVLVKVFTESSERMWFQESRIHQLTHMRHNNIHCFYASDNIATTTPDSCTRHFIILKYHRHGSLYDYLQRTVLHPYHVLTFAMSIADGLALLHSEIRDESGTKPAIAHRNISTESIYVKENGTCCISDFSLAVTSGDRSSNSELKQKPEPDYRYLAPEFLAEPPVASSIENLKKGDMYSYGLVLWEIARRCTVLGMVEDVCLPYSSVLQHTPVQREEIRKLVVSQEFRPPVPDQWNRDETMRIILRTITECWHGNSTVRLTPLRVKKTLLKLSQHIQPGMYDKNGKLCSIDRTNPMTTMAPGTSDAV